MLLCIWSSLNRAIAIRYPAQLSACSSSWSFSLMIEITSTWQGRVRSMPCIWTATFLCDFLSMKHFFQDWTNEHLGPFVEQQSAGVRRISSDSSVSVSQFVSCRTYRLWQWPVDVPSTFDSLKRVIATQDSTQPAFFSSRTSQRLQGYLAERNSKTRK